MGISWFRWRSNHCEGGGGGEEEVGEEEGERGGMIARKEGGQ